MATKHYTKRVTRSSKRAQAAVGMFNLAAERLEAEARNQRETYEEIQASRDAARARLEAAVEALENAHLAEDLVLQGLAGEAERLGKRAQKQAEALRGLFI